MILIYNLDKYTRCRWSSNADDPSLFVKYDRNKLNILDAEKQAQILNIPFACDGCNFIEIVVALINPLQTSEAWIFWIDVCPIHENLLALAGDD